MSFQETYTWGLSRIFVLFPLYHPLQTQCHLQYLLLTYFWQIYSITTFVSKTVLEIVFIKSKCKTLKKKTIFFVVFGHIQSKKNQIINLQMVQNVIWEQSSSESSVVLPTQVKPRNSWVLWFDSSLRISLGMLFILYFFLGWGGGWTTYTKI